MPKAARSSSISPALGVVARLCNEALAVKANIEERTSVIEGLGKDLDQLLREAIPEALAEVGLSEVILEDGTRIKLDTFVSAKIPEQHKDEAFQWLRDNDSGDLIKHHIEVWYAKSQDKEAAAAVAALVAIGAPVEDSEDIHHSTLRAHVKRCVEGHVPIPLELFGAYVGTTTKITKGKNQNG